ncbi:MAG: hypothetical protein LBS51_03895 [Oscillospiraceae bacterium]|nr:hypothetical protein [Oscillospiraceae bacterium]
MKESVKRVLAMLLMASLVLSLAACGGKDGESVSDKATITAEVSPNGENTRSGDGNGEPVSDEMTTAAEVNPNVDSLFQYQPLLLEMLVNEDVVIETEDDGITLTSSAGNAGINITMFPGVQNLGKVVELIPGIIESQWGVSDAEITDGYLFGAKAKRATSAFVTADGATGVGSVSAAIANQSLYLLTLMFADQMSPSEGELFINLVASLNVLVPKEVDQTAKTAKYETKYPTAPPAPQTAEVKSTPATQWEYLPYYYYSDPGDYLPDYFYEPDYNYWSDPGDYWSWGWDDDSDWYFYDEYSDYYEYEYYESYDDYYDEDWYDYYSDYDPYDEYDYYDEYLTEEYGYGEDYADYYDSYDEASGTYFDSGDYYDDYLTEEYGYGDDDAEYYDSYDPDTGTYYDSDDYSDYDDSDYYDDYEDSGDYGDYGDYYDDSGDLYVDGGDYYDEW